MATSATQGMMNATALNLPSIFERNIVVIPFTIDV
jgi:hypothetical protein